MELHSRVTFTMQDLDRLKCIQAVIDGDLKPGRAAERHGLTVREIERIVIRYRTEGPYRAGLEAPEPTGKPSAKGAAGRERARTTRAYRD